MLLLLPVSPEISDQVLKVQQTSKIICFLLFPLYGINCNQAVPLLFIKKKNLHRLLVEPLTYERFTQTELPKMAAWLPSS